LNPIKGKKDMTEDKNDPTNHPEVPTEKKVRRKYNAIKKAKKSEEKKPAQHNKIKQEEMVKWTVFVQQETKAFVGKAVEKAGSTVTDWVDSRLRKAASDEISAKKPHTQPPAKVEDVADLIKGFAERMQANQEAAAKAQADMIQQQGQQIAALAEAVQNSQPKSLKERIFGKSKKG
jgi:hypothetical protein